MIITGEDGCVQLRRRTGQALNATISPADVNTVLNRFGFAGDDSNVLTGDRVEISTLDPRGLIFLPASWWEDGIVHHSAMFFVHVNAMGGMRVFRTFAEAINNNRGNGFPLADFTGDPLLVSIEVRDTGAHPLAGIAGYTFNTDRAAVDVTSLGDLFTEQFSAGNLSGSGTLDCFFKVEDGLCAVSGQGDRELSMILPQLLLRADLGGEFDAVFTIATPRPETPIAYEVRGMITRSAITVRPGVAVELAIDFVTTGEFSLRVGEPSGYILKEDYDRVMREQDIDFLLTEPTD